MTHVEQSPIEQDNQSDSGSNISVLRMCRCGRAPHRPKQRNCHHCNAEAAKKYRLGVKKLIEIARNVRQIVGGA